MVELDRHKFIYIMQHWLNENIYAGIIDSLDVNEVLNKLENNVKNNEIVRLSQYRKCSHVYKTFLVFSDCSRLYLNTPCKFYRLSRNFVAVVKNEGIYSCIIVYAIKKGIES